MPKQKLPLIVEPADLESYLQEPDLLLVDLCKPDIYARAHLPGAVHVDYAKIVAARPPAMGLLPDNAALSLVLSELGLTPQHHVVAYDDEGGGRAARLLWTLEVIGHTQYSLLNGGLHAWMAERRPVSDQFVAPMPSHHPVRVPAEHAALADHDFIRRHLGAPGLALVDTRTPLEFAGQKRLAARGGHIPGAVNFDWVNAMDQHHALRLRPAETLRAEFEGLGVTANKEIVVYCQTHHRSAHTYMVLKYLGYPKVRGYPGSWSDWGNRPDTPIEES